MTDVMSMQDVFDAVHRHFSEPGVELGRSADTCQYATPDGARCAVGCLLTDEEIGTLDWVVDNVGIRDINVDDLPRRLRSEQMRQFLRTLQLTHDASCSVDEFRGKLCLLAKDVGLTAPET